jgi:hypothetical protein
MNTSKWPPFTALIIAVNVFISSWTASSTTADDAASAAARRRAERRFDETFFDAKRDRSLEAAQIRLNRILKKRIETVNRLYGLNDSQTKKLELAGLGEIKRLNDGIAEQNQALLSEQKDDFAVIKYLNESPEVLALRKKLRNGPFDEKSLFAKTIKNILTPEQAAKLAKRSALAAESHRTITPATVGDLACEFSELQQLAISDLGPPQVQELQFGQTLQVHSPALEKMGHRFSPDGFSVAFRREVKYNRNPGRLPSPFRRRGSTLD